MPDTGAPAWEFFFDMKKHLRRDAHNDGFAGITSGFSFPRGIPTNRNPASRIKASKQQRSRLRLSHRFR